MFARRHAGLALAALSFAAGCGASDGPSEPASATGTPIGGQVVSAAGGDPLSPLQVVVRPAGLATGGSSTVTDSHGAFQMSVALPTGASDSVDIIVDALSATPRLYHPTLIRTTAQRAAAIASRPLVMPRASQFTSPTYGTTSQVVSLQAAFTRVCADDSNVNCNSFFPQSWLSNVALWPETALPVPLAFNRAGSTGTIAASDSIALWSAIAAMEAEVGRSLFKPATISQLGTPDANGYLLGAVLVSIDNSLASGAGFTNWSYDGGFNLRAARVRVGSAAALASRKLMPHELLHAMGFHHTCAWTTVMGGYGCLTNTGVSAQDAAAVSLAFATRRTMLSRSPTTKLFEALQGERLLEGSVLASRMTAQLSEPIAFAPRQGGVVRIGGLTLTVDGAP